MNELLTGDTLDLYLSDIKAMFRNYDYNRLKKMIFMSVDSFFGFIDDDTPRGSSGMSFKEIIETIEPFIPLVINDKNLDSYLMAAVTQDEDELMSLQYQFIQHAKIRFVKNVMGAENDDDIEEIFDVCRTIREYKAKSAQ